MPIIKNYTEATASFGNIIISGSLIMTGSSSGSFTGSLSGSVNGYSSSLGWLDNFASSSNSGSFSGSFTGSLSGSLTGSFNGWSGSLDWVDNFPTASYRTGSFTGSFTGSLNGSSSYATTSSYVTGIKSGVIRFTEWGVDLVGEYTSSVTFSTSYSNSSYAITLTCGSDIRTLTVISKLSSGFTVSSNSTNAMTDSIYWICVPYNNP